MIQLTAAQARALAAVAITGTRQEAADLLGRSPNTVDAHLAVAFYRLGVTSLSEAFRRAGWLEPPLELLGLEEPEQPHPTIEITGLS